MVASLDFGVEKATCNSNVRKMNFFFSEPWKRDLHLPAGPLWFFHLSAPEVLEASGDRGFSRSGIGTELPTGRKKVKSRPEKVTKWPPRLVCQ